MLLKGSVYWPQTFMGSDVGMGKTVILREDDRDLAALVLELLEDAGYKVVLTESIEETLAAAARNSPCLALIDGTSPTSFDLWWLGPELSKLGVPPIAFTAHASARADFQADSCGYVGVVGKPFDADEFLSLVDSVCWAEHQGSRAAAS